MKAVIPISRVESQKAILKGICIWCEEEAKEFHNEEAKQTYQKFGVCQKCQDTVFGMHGDVEIVHWVP